MNNDKPIDRIATEGRFTRSNIDEIVAKYIELKKDLEFIKECREKNMVLPFRSYDGTDNQ